MTIAIHRLTPLFWNCLELNLSPHDIENEDDNDENTSESNDSDTGPTDSDSDTDGVSK